MPDFRIFPKFRDDEVRDPSVRNKLNRTNEGKMNINGQFTLRANQTTTTLSDIVIDSVTVLQWTPMTSTAAGALTNLRQGTTVKGSIILNHASASSSDRIFRYSVVG